MKNCLLIVSTVVVLAAPVNAAYYVAGDFNGWNAAGSLMTETSSGIWSLSIPGVAVGRREFKITDGTWEWSFPGPNSWYYDPGSGLIRITFNTNSVSDGWLPEQNRLSVSYEPGSWTIAGSFQGWNNANPETAMISLGRGVHMYMLSRSLAPGSYAFKPVVTGTWDSITSVERSTGTPNMFVTIPEGLEVMNIYVDALEGKVRMGSELGRMEWPYDPIPASGAVDVLVGDIEFSWSVAQVPTLQDPNIVDVDPNLVSHKVYLSDGSWDNDPNLNYAGSVTGWDAESLRASFTPGFALKKDARYFWRVDMVFDDAVEIKGDIWTFYTELARPIITEQTVSQVIKESETAVFAVTVSSASAPIYQWYKVVEGGSDMELSDSGNISGSLTNTLSIENIASADEGYYYCIVNNDSGIPAESASAPLAIKSKLAHWDFESDNFQSVVAGSPVSFLHGAPVFDSGFAGQGMAFSADAGGDLLYTDPEEVSYFDICNYQMTVSLWIKSSFAATWGPMVARNGEDGQGWQLRHRGDTLDRICFTTRGTGNDDGRASNRTVYDGNWHYVAATYDGAVKKVYIDGVVSRVYNGDDGSIAADFEEASGVINAADAPVALAGRVRRAAGNLVFEDVTPCILDEVEIYNYALDAAAIAQNYANRTGTSVCPVPQDYDLDGDCRVDLNDFALLASRWLSDISVQPVL
jgi:hypothetical protein